MSSPLFDAVNAASKEASEAAVKEISKRQDYALGQLENAIYEKLQQVIEKDMMDYYYNAYSPFVYNRLDMVRNDLVDPLIKHFNDGKTKGFHFGIQWTPENMHHILGYRTSKNENGKIEYHDAFSEEQIAINFSKGIHPNTEGHEDRYFYKNKVIWEKDNPDNVGYAADIVRQWAKENIDLIFKKALSDIMSK